MYIKIFNIFIFRYRDSGKCKWGKYKKLKFKVLVNIYVKLFNLRNILFKNIYIYISGYGLNSR